MHPGCMTEGLHGLHWVPEGMLGDMTVEGLCAGTPRAFVLGRDGRRSEVTDLAYVPALDQFRYTHIASGMTNFAAPERVTIAWA